MIDENEFNTSKDIDQDISGNNLSSVHQSEPISLPFKRKPSTDSLECNANRRILFESQHLRDTSNDRSLLSPGVSFYLDHVELPCCSSNNISMEGEQITNEIFPPFYIGCEKLSNDDLVKGFNDDLALSKGKKSKNEPFKCKVRKSASEPNFEALSFHNDATMTPAPPCINYKLLILHYISSKIYLKRFI